MIWDLDRTVVDSSSTDKLRSLRKWPKVYALIANYSIYPGILEGFRYLVSRNVPYCIVTSSPEAYCRRVLDHWNVPYNHLVCWHDTTFQKPHPEPIEKALAKIGSTPKRTLSLGDRVIDLRSSRSAGTRTVACLWGAIDANTLLDTIPDFTLRASVEVLPLFQKFFA